MKLVKTCATTGIPHLKEFCDEHLWAPSCYHGSPKHDIPGLRKKKRILGSQNTSEKLKTKDYARDMMSLSYYFLVVGLYDIFEKCLDEVEDGSKEYKKQTEYPKEYP